ncbi:S8 family serine peptidase [Zobellia nedashkovskayae]|uniref:S8 family serine peptidase n=1 Tax=Zobellia nedashkovskayae TaxID=2779510 RepID=UPI00188CC6C0|nr:S8 family serine peptidase [Zobellia nedashkovskayae]
MKTKITFLLLLTIILSSCTKLGDFQGSSNGEDGETEQEYSRTQVIVRFNEKVTTTERTEIRNENGIGENYTPCSCGDKNIELWDTDPSGDPVELIVEKLRRRSGAEGDLLFNISIKPIVGFEPKGIPGSLDEQLIPSNQNNSKINIAVIDSGVDYGLPFSTPYLLQTSDLIDCNNSPSGYNFTTEGAPNDILDLNGHGSMVTKIITSELDKNKHSYSILPIKAFNKDGEGSYWNVICAFGYVQEVQKAGANINIVNASFGKAIDKHLFTENNLLNTMIQELGTTGVLVVTSAGNDSLDTDFSDKRHFPSGFIADNILSIGGYDDANGATPTIDRSSNYGTISIDVAAPFRDWSVTSIATADGTSFSTAFVTGLISNSFIASRTSDPIQLKTDFLNNNYGNVQYSNSLNAFIKNGAYVKR